MTDKFCKACCRFLPPSAYTDDRRATDGKQSRCKECCTKAQRERYAANPERFRKQVREYRAANPERLRAIAAKTRAKNREAVLAGKRAHYDRVKQDPEWQAKQREIRAKNKQKKKEYDAARVQTNRAAYAERAKEWKRKNPERRASIIKAYDARRRSNKANGDSTKAIHEWEMAQRKVCYWCGEKCANDYHLDHYTPLSAGGKHEIANLVIACPPCNLRKNAKDPYKFAQEAGRLF